MIFFWHYLCLKRNQEILLIRKLYHCRLDWMTLGIDFGLYPVNLSIYRERMRKMTLNYFFFNNEISTLKLTLSLFGHSQWNLNASSKESTASKATFPSFQ